ncbi:2-amino-4-hydroxy-6-hydroxymethyldihydropteridine diphosphokinase [Pseudogemmobacter sonorensis]|uniref:2-amino-4-hydroxy-6- hydroxymethyldihydropteridine diphosphokinase n=1 Tax=Pseudogemmobacter sonorensis TaxID=2989681 RepID=UPI0036CDB268
MKSLEDTASRPAVIALGANLPFQGHGPARTLRRALAEFSARGLGLGAVSRFYSTPCFPPGAGPDYVNAAALITAGLPDDPASILGLLHGIEAEFGRERLERWGMRTLDLDLVALGESVLPDARTQDGWRALPQEEQGRNAPDQPILPHPRLQDRAFVLVPMLDILPHWRHPRLGLDVGQMLAALPPEDRAAIRPLADGN